MKIFKKLSALVLAAVLCLSVIACTTNNSKDNNSSLNQEMKLSILESSIEVNQEQQLSRIKAEYLIENEGYKDDDEVVLILSLGENALIDSFLASPAQNEMTLAEYASTNAGQNIIKNIKAKQDELISDLYEEGLILGVERTYQTIMNGVAVKVKYKDFNSVSSNKAVKTVVMSDEYNRLSEETTTGSSAVENVVDVYDTGIYKSDSVSYTGVGTAVAVLDTGFDITHEVFQRQPNCDTSELLLKPSDVSAVLQYSNANITTPGVEVADVYYSTKIPYAYDYADKDTNPFTYDAVHGTHVAGIIGGYSDVITGVAIDTQLVLMKVFPDLKSGAETEDILAALEDSVLLGVDCINMSLGSSCGFAREVDKENVNAVYDKINNAGINLLTAASNDHSSAYGSATGNTNKVTNPDSGTVGSPSTYEAALSVASISGVKSSYILANDSFVFFFLESNDINGDKNDFFDELYTQLNVDKTEDIVLDYVTVPGIGMKANFAAIDVRGKVALIKRGDTTFEEKAANAKAAGAIAVIIYNNVEGDINMSMGKTDHLPTVSISKDDGTELARYRTGTLKISSSNQAGPFMSDFSSWGPTNDLQLKPEITAHGGDILSSVPGNRYDHLSGTSMACPNLCGAMVLLRQYVNENFEGLTWKEKSNLANQLIMSTATIIKNQVGNPYSPRKVGAGLASLFNAVNTYAYLTVDGINRTKLELGDDKERTGVYDMEFNIVNIADHTISYELGILGMSESVSTYDDTHVKEMAHMLDGAATYSLVTEGTNAVLNGNNITVPANATVKVKVHYTLTEEDKAYIDSLFPYGMYVEGYVTLKAKAVEGVTLDEDEQHVDLNIPFLAFYGDWTEAPLLDKTYYEVQKDAKDDSINADKKTVADYYATTPFSMYMYNYIIPLGTYIYDIDTDKYDAIAASTEHAAVSTGYGTMEGIGAMYIGLLRNAKMMTMQITDKVTGEVIWEEIEYNCYKAHANGGSPIPFYEKLELTGASLGLINNRQYSFKLVAQLDYDYGVEGDLSTLDGGLTTNIRNSFEFDFYYDTEAPVIEDVSYEKIYDKTLKKNRYYITMNIYDNHYTMNVLPIIFLNGSTYTTLDKNGIPVYSDFNSTSKVRFEITDYLEDIGQDYFVTSAIGFLVQDYAMNEQIYLCQLPGTNGEFKFTQDGKTTGTEVLMINAYVGEVIDLTKYLSTTDPIVDVAKDYLKTLVWTSSNDTVCTVKEGLVRANTTGRVTITCLEKIYGENASIIVNVKRKTTTSEASTNTVATDYSTKKIESLRFDYFTTVYAYPRSGASSDLGDIGNKNFIQNLDGAIEVFPGEQFQLHYDVNPWYVDGNYEYTFKSGNSKVATVDQNGTVKGLKEGSTLITLTLKGSNIQASIRVTVKSEFVIESRQLIAYKGLGGDVVIPDDEGIIYIAKYAFCLYETDRYIACDEDDWDRNKIPQTNTTITSITIPEGVTNIEKLAFSNCLNLKTVIIPDSVEYIRDYAFYNTAIETIDLNQTIAIGQYCFANCTQLRQVNLENVYAIGTGCFSGCTLLESVNLTGLRNCGVNAFKDCTSLSSAVLNADTCLSVGMFINTGLVTVDIYANPIVLDKNYYTYMIPQNCFAKCKNLTTVNIHGGIYGINKGAFSETTSLQTFNFLGECSYIADDVFYSSGLQSLTLPNCEVQLGTTSFYKCNNLTTINFAENTHITNLSKATFGSTNVSSFVVDPANNYYSTNGNYLLNKDGNTIYLALSNVNYGALVIGEAITTINEGAFSGLNMTSVEFENPSVVIGKNAFAQCNNLTTVTFDADSTNVQVKEYAFANCTKLANLVNFDKVYDIGSYSFYQSGVQNVVIADNAVVQSRAFYQASINAVTFGNGANIGASAFEDCDYLTNVTIGANGVHFGKYCFAYSAQLATINLENYTGRLEDYTFYQCPQLKAADLTNVTQVGDYCFAGCQSLATCNLGNVTWIEDYAFANVPDAFGAPSFTINDVPASLQFIGVGAFRGMENITNVTIPAGATVVCVQAFKNCSNLVSVTLPNTVTKISNNAFEGCSKLASINLDNVKEIGDYAFTNTTLLTNVNLSNVESIGKGAFASSGLTCALNMSKLETVSDYAFLNEKITSVSAPKLKSIGVEAFENASELTEFTFANTLEFVGQMAFLGCNKLAQFNVANGATKETTATINAKFFVDNASLYEVYDNGLYELKSVPAGLNVETLTVKYGTARVDFFAGNANPYVKTVSLPDELKLVGNYAFYGYNNLTKVICNSVVAPRFEDTYIAAYLLTTDDPAYSKLHNQYGLFVRELCYYNIIALLGTKEPIQLVVPKNADIEGYDSLVYRTYFGETFTRSNYVAKEQAIIKFMENANVLKDLAIEDMTLYYENYINDAITYYNQITQDPATYGISSEVIASLYNKVNECKVVLRQLKLRAADKEVKEIQAIINELGEHFNASDLSKLKSLKMRISQLKTDEKSILDLSNYNSIMEELQEFINVLNGLTDGLAESLLGGNN